MLKVYKKVLLVVMLLAMIFPVFMQFADACCENRSNCCSSVINDDRNFVNGLRKTRCMIICEDVNGKKRIYRCCESVKYIDSNNSSGNNNCMSNVVCNDCDSICNSCCNC
ncbi:MAG: hypothetical protein LBM05_02300 [Endomicrobium sp.]|jgi:hypothetical protein|nr:hypothetical protein [Endomicrobium sp.]